MLLPLTKLPKQKKSSLKAHLIWNIILNKNNFFDKTYLWVDMTSYSKKSFYKYFFRLRYFYDREQCFRGATLAIEYYKLKFRPNYSPLFIISQIFSKFSRKLYHKIRIFSLLLKVNFSLVQGLNHIYPFIKQKNKWAKTEPVDFVKLLVLFIVRRSPIMINRLM